MFRLLVRAGPDGVAAGAIAAALDIPPQTLSFHLKHLTSVGLVQHRRQGRSLLYSLCAPAMRELLGFLSEDCCQGRRELCVPVGKPPKARLTEFAGASDRPTVLFLCTRNSARSQIAAAMLQKHGGDRFVVHSAGLRPRAVHPLTLRVLQEIGIDTSACRAKDIGEFLGKQPIHHAIVVCEHANEHCPQLYPFAVRRHYWPFEDPAALEGSPKARLAKFREVRDAIETRVRAWLEEAAQGAHQAG